MKLLLLCHSFNGLTQRLHFGPGLVEVDQHDDASLGGDTGERDEADGDRDGKIEAEPPHQPESAHQRER